MAGSPEASSGSEDETILRFVPGSRIVHWAHAVPFLFLLLSGLSLFVPSIKAVHVGGYRLMPLLHVLVGIAFIVSPLPLYLALGDRGEVTRDLRRLFRFERDDANWAAYALSAVLGGHMRQPLVGKFNSGQKANTAFTVVVTAGLMLTGAVLAVNYFTKRVFAAQFVERIFPFHDFFAVVVIPVLAAHIYLGGVNPSTRESLRGMTTGRVRRGWARAHHPLWADRRDDER